MSETIALSLEEREAALLKREAELDAREAALVEREAALNKSVPEDKVEGVESEEPPAGNLSLFVFYYKRYETSRFTNIGYLSLRCTYH